jgi:hypothetical protein
MLADTFPSLERAPGVHPWDALKVEKWAVSGGPSHGELCAARFILAVWNQYDEWRCGPFDVMDALRVWDLPHRKAFLDWAADPWWA